MCKVVSVNVGDKEIRVADIKQKYIANIIDAAHKCDYIDRVVLFGSSTTSKCRQDSDIDLAVFGNQPKGKCLSSKKFRKFTDQLATFDDFLQAYDILYFKTGQDESAEIMGEIAKGEELYAR